MTHILAFGSDGHQSPFHFSGFSGGGRKAHPLESSMSGQNSIACYLRETSTYTGIHTPLNLSIRSGVFEQNQLKSLSPLPLFLLQKHRTFPLPLFPHRKWSPPLLNCLSHRPILSLSSLANLIAFFRSYTARTVRRVCSLPSLKLARARATTESISGGV